MSQVVARERGASFYLILGAGVFFGGLLIAPILMVVLVAPLHAADFHSVKGVARILALMRYIVMIAGVVYFVKGIALSKHEKEAAAKTSVAHATAPGSGTIEERLRDLETLVDQDIITAEEYRRKRREILDDL